MGKPARSVASRLCWLFLFLLPSTVFADPPVVTISSPYPGSTIANGEAVTFGGAAHDDLDGPLPDSALTWSSDRDGIFASGGSVTFTRLTSSAHVIRLTAVNSRAELSSATLALSVVPPARPR